MSAEVHPCCLTIAGSDSGGNVAKEITRDSLDER